MFNLEKQALQKINIGIAIIDREKRVLFWNNELKKLSGVPEEEAVGKMFCEVCPKFSEKRYCDMLENLFNTGQSRFCSSQLHKAFIYNPESHDSDIYQNLTADLVSEDNTGYALIQIMDVTDNTKKHKQLKETIVKLESGYKKIKESEEAAQKEANYDMLTGVLNRHGLELELQNLLGSESSSNRKHAVLFMDIDKFKGINDCYGHLIGDVLLQQAAGRIRSNTRQNRGRNPDILARLGGDEFVLILTDIDKNCNIALVAEKITNSIKMPFSIDNKKITVSTSIGIAIYPDDSEDVNTLFGQADKAMYTVKKAGGGEYVFYSQCKNGSQD